MPLDTFMFYVPLGLVGLARWVSWTIRRIPALFYRTIRSRHREPITVVSPVLQEDPRVFRAALESWLANKHVVEVICVIHESDHSCLAVASRYPVTVLRSSDPRKRQAMRLGWEHASTDLVALADSDTIWAPDVSDRVCEPFEDPTIGGVGTRQNVLEPTTIWHRLNDIYLNYRYFDEIASQSAFGRAVSCLSGRTVVYRRELLVQVADEFTSETFLGVTCLSGDDKRLTSLALRRGWKTHLQRSARCWSALPDNGPMFFRQRLRWARNTWRSDLRALGEGWVFRHGFLAFCLIDKGISPFTQLLSPIYFSLAIARGNWLFAGILVAWWLVSRGVKILPHLRRRPMDVAILPAFILLTFVMALVKIYALATCRRQGWLTREAPVQTPVTDPTAARTSVLALLPRAVPSGLRVAALVAVAGLALLVPVALPRPVASIREGGTIDQRPEAGYVGPHPVECLRRAGNPTDCREQRGFPPDPFARGAASHLRGMSVRPDGIDLIAGGNVVRTIPSDLGSRGGRLDELVDVVSDASWIAEPEPGVYELRAAIKQQPGTRLVFGGRSVRVLRLSADSGAFIQGRSAKARFENIQVTSWIADLRGPDRNTRDGRPFIVYEKDSTLDITDSSFDHLGSDSSRAYGVAWLSGSSGHASGSTFRRNFFGVHLSHANRVILESNTFVRSAFYGVNMHTDASKLVAEHNVSRNNGAHGFALAEGVMHSRVVDNHIHDNGGNGILIYDDSVANRIEDNFIHRNADGIAIIDSAANVIEENHITTHRIGIRVQGARSTENILRDNTISTSENGIYVYGKPDVVRLLGNSVSDTDSHAVTADAGRTSIIGGDIRGAHVGLDLRGRGTVEGLQIDARHGVFARPEASTTLRNVRITAGGSGIRLDEGSAIELKRSSVMAPTPVESVASKDGLSSTRLTAATGNSLVRRPKPVYGWLPYVGLMFVLAAIAFEFLRANPRSDRDRPAHPSESGARRYSPVTQPTA